MPAANEKLSRLGDPIAVQNIFFLEQGLDLLATLDDADYARSFPPAFECGIGAHIRHIVDHYDCFLRGLDTGRIDYDRRQRNERIESDRMTGIDALRATIARLQDIDGAGASIELAVHMDCGDGAAGDGIFSRTSLTRELQFLLSHTVHHYALVAVILRLEGREPVDGFGVSPSTLRNWRESN